MIVVLNMVRVPMDPRFECGFLVNIYIQREQIAYLLNLVHNQVIKCAPVFLITSNCIDSLILCFRRIFRSYFVINFVFACMLHNEIPSCCIKVIVFCREISSLGNNIDLEM